MARPAIIKGRFFKRISDGMWTHRVDTQSPMTLAEAEAHCSAEFGFPVSVVAVELPAADFDVLVAQRMVGAILPPVQPPTPLTPEQVEFAAADIAKKALMVHRQLGLVQ